MADETIRSFLVGLGWKNDEAQQRKFVAAIESATLKANLMAEALEAVAVKAASAVQEAAGRFEDLAYHAERTGASAKTLKAFEYAAQQVGSSAEEAAAAIEGIAAALRKNPGYEVYAEKFGFQIDKVTKKLEYHQDLMQKGIGSMPITQAEQYRALLNYPERLMLGQRNHPAEFGRAIGDKISSMAAGGLDPEQAIKDGVKFEQTWREILSHIEDRAASWEAKVQHYLIGPLETLDGYLKAHPELSDLILGGSAAAGGVGLWATISKLFGSKGGGDAAKAAAGPIGTSAAAIMGLSGGALAWAEGHGNASIHKEAEDAIKSGNLKVNGVPVTSGNPLPVRIDDGAGSGGGFWQGLWNGAKSLFGASSAHAETEAGSLDTNGVAQRNGAGGKFNAASAAALIRKVGGTPEEAAVLGAIAMAESRGNPNAHNPHFPDNSYGLWQINMLGNMGPERLRRFGLKNNEDLYDPETNARVALAMHRAAKGYRDWSTYTSGAFRPYIEAARQGATEPMVQSPAFTAKPNPFAIPPSAYRIGAGAFLAMPPAAAVNTNNSSSSTSNNVTQTNHFHVSGLEASMITSQVASNMDRRANDIASLLQGAAK